MEEQKKSAIVRFPAILWAVMVVLLGVVPCGALPTGPLIGPQTVDSDEILYLGTIYDPNVGVEMGYVDVYGTLNMYPGAYVDWGIYTYSGSTVNIYAGSAVYFIKVYEGAYLTVYGTDFADEDDSLVYGEWTPKGGAEILTGYYEDESTIALYIWSDIPINLEPPPSGGPIEVQIDIKPGSDQNSINLKSLKSKGVVPVAVMTTNEFVAATVDPATALFAGAEPVRWKLEDVDDDGDDDLIFHFKTQELDLNPDSTEATLTAELLTEESVSGTDEVRIIPSKKSKKSKK